MGYPHDDPKTSLRCWEVNISLFFFGRYEASPASTLHGGPGRNLLVEKPSYEGFHKWGYLKNERFIGENPFQNRWFMATPILRKPPYGCASKCCVLYTPKIVNEKSGRWWWSTKISPSKKMVIACDDPEKKWVSRKLHGWFSSRMFQLFQHHHYYQWAVITIIIHNVDNASSPYC